jgi:hypothetical protein
MLKRLGDVGYKLELFGVLVAVIAMKRLGDECGGKGSWMGGKHDAKSKCNTNVKFMYKSEDKEIAEGVGGVRW